MLQQPYDGDDRIKSYEKHCLVLGIYIKLKLINSYVFLNGVTTVI